MERIKVEDVSYSYISKYQKIDALRQVSCSFEEGKLYAVIGESGSGKSTLLSLLAGLDLPSEGTIYIDGQDLASMDRDAYRRDKASVVYQSFHLFPLFLCHAFGFQLMLSSIVPCNGKRPQHFLPEPFIHLSLILNLLNPSQP